MSFTLPNTGQRIGGEVAQLYVRDVVSTVFRPEQELQGFVKVVLEPGERRTLRMPLTRRDVEYSIEDSLSGWAQRLPTEVPGYYSRTDARSLRILRSR